EEEQVGAVLAQDIPTLERLWSPQMTVNNPQNGISPNRDAVIDRVRRALILYSRYELKIEAFRVSGDLAIVMGSETVVPKGEAPRAGQTVHRRYTNIWARSGSTWHSDARHANVVLEHKSTLGRLILLSRLMRSRSRLRPGADRAVRRAGRACRVWKL